MNERVWRNANPMNNTHPGDGGYRPAQHSSGAVLLGPRRPKRTGRVHGLLHAAVLTTVLSGADFYGVAQKVGFADTNLEWVVRQELGRPNGPLTYGDLQSLTTLDATSRGIVSLAGLEMARNLLTLNIASNLVTDIRPLLDLPDLEFADLRYNHLDICSPSILDIVGSLVFTTVLFDPQAVPCGPRLQVRVETTTTELVTRLSWETSNLPIGQWYELQCSSNLVDWSMTRYAKGTGLPIVLDEPLTARQVRFYRVKMIPPEGRMFITKRVLVLNYDPILRKHGGVRLHQYLGWNDPHVLNRGYLQDLAEVSGGYVHWDVVEFFDLDEFPPFADGFRYDEDSYLQVLSTHQIHQPSAGGYVRIIEQFDLDRRVRNGEVDEVIMWAGPWSTGFWESQMVGSGAYWCNSPPIERPGTPLYVMMALNYERGLECALESFGHRSESILWQVYGGWNSGTTIRHLWDKFTRIAKDAPGLAACGNVHYPPNGIADYDYANGTYVDSSADDWLLNYPDFKGITRRFNAAEWNFDHRQYLKWWYNHMPRKPGRYSDGKLNNWWGYLVDFNAYSESR